jgi:hypothetical protein
MNCIIGFDADLSRKELPPHRHRDFSPLLREISGHISEKIKKRG